MSDAITSYFHRSKIERARYLRSILLYAFKSDLSPQASERERAIQLFFSQQVRFHACSYRNYQEPIEFYFFNCLSFFFTLRSIIASVPL